MYSTGNFLLVSKISLNFTGFPHLFLSPRRCLSVKLSRLLDSDPYLLLPGLVTADGGPSGLGVRSLGHVHLLCLRRLLTPLV